MYAMEISNLSSSHNIWDQYDNIKHYSTIYFGASTTNILQNSPNLISTMQGGVRHSMLSY